MFQGKNKEEADFEYFSIFDSKTGQYFKPFTAINTLDVLRIIQNDFKNPETHKEPMFSNAEDYSVFKIGSFFKKTGILTGIKPEHVVNLHEIKSLVQRTKPEEITQ